MKLVVVCTKHEAIVSGEMKIFTGDYGLSEPDLSEMDCPIGDECNQSWLLFQEVK